MCLFQIQSLRKHFIKIQMSDDVSSDKNHFSAAAEQPKKS